jgi:hypothetical protein
VEEDKETGNLVVARILSGGLIDRLVSHMHVLFVVTCIKESKVMQDF